jgi:hypothetical protein
VHRRLGAAGEIRDGKFEHDAIGLSAPAYRARRTAAQSSPFSVVPFAHVVADGVAIAIVAWSKLRCQDH